MAIFLSQQSRQYFSSPLGSETSFALQSAHRACATDLRGIHAELYQLHNAALWSCEVAELLPPDARLVAQGRRVHVVDVILHHSPRAEARRNGGDRLAHERQPAPGDAVLVV